MVHLRVISLLVVCSVIGFSYTAISAEPYQTAGWIGTNYTPAYAVNQVQFWHDFRPDAVERELAAAKNYFGITTLRVYLHNIPYDAEKATFLDNIEQFLVICDRHGIKPGFTFFDDCHRHDDIFLTNRPSRLRVITMDGGQPVLRIGSEPRKTSPSSKPTCKT